MGKSKKSLRGRWAVVTGAEGGIGSEFCLELARRGADIVAIGIQDGALADLAERLRGHFQVNVLSLRIDLTTPDATSRIFSFLDEKGIVPYLLINNAGIFSFREVAETTAQKVDMFVDLHVRSVTQLSREMARRMMEAGEGRILNMSSMSCWMPMPGIALYSATKAYIRVFSRALHYETRDRGVTVTVACPGGIATDLFGLPDNLKKLAVGIGVLATPEKFASKAIDKALKGKKQYINGLINRLSIFFVGITPTWVRMLVKHKMLDKGIAR